MSVLNTRKSRALICLQLLEKAAVQRDLVESSVLAKKMKVAVMGPAMRLALMDCHRFCMSTAPRYPILTSLMTYDKTEHMHWFYEEFINHHNLPGIPSVLVKFMFDAREHCYSFYATLGCDLTPK